jgi:hypothetical protein
MAGALRSSNGSTGCTVSSPSGVVCSPTSTSNPALHHRPNYPNLRRTWTMPVGPIASCTAADPKSTGLQSPAITSLSANFDARQEELLTKSRVDLREGYSLLASVAAGHQAEDSARVGRLVSIVTALLLVPSLIVSCVGIRPRRLRERRQSHDRRAPPRAVARGASPAPLFSWRSGSRSSRLSRRAGLP